MALEKFKDVSMGDRKFQISRFTPDTGSWIAFQVMTKVMPSWVGVESTVPDSIRSMPRAELSESEFRSIQAHCMKVCAEYRTIGDVTTPVPILMADGRYSDPDMDLATVMGITTHALMFNLAPLFTGDALKAVTGSLRIASETGAIH